MDKTESLHRSPKKKHTEAKTKKMLHHHVPQQIKTLKNSSLQDNFFLLRLTSFHKCQVLSFCTCCCAVATSPSNSRAPQRGLKLRRRSCLPTTKKTGAAILNLFWNLAFFRLFASSSSSSRGSVLLKRNLAIYRTENLV